MRVLVTSTPGRGHLHPMMPLARALLDRGDEILWATAAEACPLLEREGFRTTAAGAGEPDLSRFVALPEIQALPPPERPNHLFSRVFGPTRAGPMLDDLMPVAAEWRPALVVHDAAELAGPIAAASLGIPNVSHGFGALLPEVRVSRAGDALAPLWTEHDLEPRPHAGCYEHLYLDIYPSSLHSPERSHVRAVQLLKPATFATSGDEPLPDLVTKDRSDPLVYVTFGTLFRNDEVLVGVLDGLRDLPVRVLMTVGPRGDPTALGAQPANVHVARYIAQEEVLPHCDAVVSHGGSGTFLAALTAGLPQLCLPQGADQFLNADACARSGSGLTLHPDAFAVEEVRRAVQRLLSDPSFRAAAERAGGEITTMPSPSEVADRLHADYG